MCMEDVVSKSVLGKSKSILGLQLTTKWLLSKFYIMSTEFDKNISDWSHYD